MLIGWTTVETALQAEELAAGLVAARLAACVQIEGPVISHYRWEGRPQRATEFRLTVKFLPDRQLELEAWLYTRHPYQTPEWVVVQAEYVAEKYLSWARANSTSVTL
ncbi:MAG TPA: divalent-cation tolerance protein CutA [Opitutaceae bacterium]